MRPTLVYFTLATCLIVLGIILRFIPLGLPFFYVKYGGSAFWAAMIYFLLAALLPHRNPGFVAAIAIAFTTLLEVFRLFHTPTLDAFRLTLAGALLLGRFFDPWHLVAYTSSILFVAILDRLLTRPRLIRA